MRGFRLAWLTLLTACNSALTPVPGIGDSPVQSRPIINGEEPDAPEHAAVVGLHQARGRFVYTTPFCSGTLIAPEVVLTAAHCLAGKQAAQVLIYVGDDPAADLLAHLYELSEIAIHPDWHSSTLSNDIALARLASPITEVLPVPPLPQAVAFSDQDVGIRLNFAGFGVDEDGMSGVKLQADGSLGGFGCSVPGCPGPGDAATMISYAQAAAGPCYGDSGGPAFVYRDGVAYVGGLTSYGDADCAIYGVSTRTDTFASWIAAFAGAPACITDGVCDASCTSDPDCGGNSCGDATCDAGESCDGRLDTLACPSDCPGRLKGKPATRYCFVEGACTGPGCP